MLRSTVALGALGPLAFVLFGAGCGDDSSLFAQTGGGPASGGAGGDAAGGSAGAAVGGSGGAGAAGGSGGSSGFTLEVHTSLGPDGALVLTTNLPRSIDECGRVPGAPCEDLDADLLTDAWEGLVLDRLRPLVRLDEAESLVGEPGFAMGMVGRVAPVGGALHAYMMLGYARDFGSCGGFTSHNGDSERVVLELTPLRSGSGDVAISQAYTAAHEGTVSDAGQVFAGGDLTQLVHEDDPTHGEPRWVVFASADKHATYATIDICEGVSFLPCFDEDCGADGVADPSAYELLMPYVNAGEETQPMVTDLAALGFPGDDAWADQDFCGGLGGSGCSSSVRSKLLVDPF